MSRILLLLPEQPTRDPGAHWWRIDGGEIVECGQDGRWIELSSPPLGALMGLAPATAVRLVFSEPVGATARQATAIAAAAARETSLSDEGAVHTAAAISGDGDHRRAVAAVVASESMRQWLEWFRSFGREPAAIIPSALLLSGSDEWVDVRIGSEHLAGRGDLRFAYEPALAEALIGDERVRRMPADELEQVLVRTAEAPPLNLLQGPFGPRRGFRMERGRVRELALLAACIPLLALLVMVVSIIRLNRDADRLDREAVEAASMALNRPVTAETALAELDLQSARSGGTGGSLSAPLAALYQQMQADPAVTATALGWRGDGTLSTTLAAARAEDINRLLLALQRAGYTVTAVPRTGTDGRQLADITIRSGG